MTRRAKLQLVAGAPPQAEDREAVVAAALDRLAVEATYLANFPREEARRTSRDIRLVVDAFRPLLWLLRERPLEALPQAELLALREAETDPAKGAAVQREIERRDCLSLLGFAGPAWEDK